jgi:ketosteroid isomerase-like protein
LKKLVWLTVMVIAWVYGSGYFAFTGSNVNGFLNQWEAATAKGDAEAICQTLADDMTFSMHDESSERPFDMEGNKEDFCAYLEKALPMMSKVVSSMQLTREDLIVKRQGWFGWRAEVSYTEHRVTGIADRMSVKTISTDKLLLVKTLSGVLVKRLDSENRRDDES